MVSCWYFLCSGLLCLAHTREMFTSLWRSSNHLELSRQPEGPGLRCHLFYYIYIKYIIFTINSINENRCCISILQLWEIAVGHEDVYVHSSLIKKVTPPFNQSSPMNRKWFPILFFSGIFAPVLLSWTVLEGEWLILTGKKFTLMTNQTSSKNQKCAPTWI